MKLKKASLWPLILVLLAVFLFLGGLGIETTTVYYFGALIGFLLLGLAAIWQGRLRLPSRTLLYGLFLILFALSLLWSRDARTSLEYFALFLSGGLLWLVSFNLKKELSFWLDKLVILLAVIFGAFFLQNRFFGQPTVSPWSFHLAYSSSYDHYHIGDLWAVALTIVVFYIIRKKEWWHWLLVGLGIYFLAASLSRSAYVALAAGVSYLFYSKKWLYKYRRVFISLVVLAVALFLFAGLKKPLIHNRQYYFQAIVGFLHNPLGVGVGNFGVISGKPVYHLWGFSGFSCVVHNIVLELLVGMGVFGFAFVVWLVKVFTDIWKDKDGKDLIYKAIFVSLGVNLMFDSTYFVPTMLWLWFMALGLSQKSR
jgi:hypothetical protein